jgi:hypothetical protein
MEVALAAEPQPPAGHGSRLMVPPGKCDQAHIKFFLQLLVILKVRLVTPLRGGYGKHRARNRIADRRIDQDGSEGRDGLADRWHIRADVSVGWRPAADGKLSMTGTLVGVHLPRSPNDPESAMQAFMSVTSSN